MNLPAFWFRTVIECTSYIFSLALTSVPFTFQLLASISVPSLGPKPFPEEQVEGVPHSDGTIYQFTF